MFELTDMAQEYAASTQSPLPDGWHDAHAQLEDGFRDVGPALGHQGLGDYYDTEALAAYSGAPEFYVPDPDASAEASGSADPNSNFSLLHYLPPAAISRKYYTLQDPNVYPTAGPSTPSYAPTLTASSSTSSPATTETYYDGSLTTTSSPALKVEQQSPTSWLTPPPGPPESPLTTESSYDVLATPTPAPTPLASPTYYQHQHQRQHQYQHQHTYQDPGSHFQPTHGAGWQRTASGPPECAHPVLPKQRRNRDDPGGDAGRLAQVCANSQGEFEQQTGAGLPYYVAAPGAAQTYQGAATAGQHPRQQQQQQHQNVEPEPAVVPSQWKVGAALDRLRFPQYEGDDWDALMAALYGEGYQACVPRSNSPLSAEDMAQFEQLRLGFGLGLSSSVLASASAQPTTPITPITPATPGPADNDDTKLVVYSPMTGRRIPVTAGPNGGHILKLSAVPPSARRPYKRGAVAACAFCRRRKIACGGPKEGDEAGRCGQCIQRQQPCEFPGSSYQTAAHPVPLVAPPYGYAPPAYGVGDPPHSG